MFAYFLVILSISLKFSHASQACGNPKEPLHLPFGDTAEGVSICTVKSAQDKRKLEELSEQNYEMEYCLWEDMLPEDNEKLCQYEVKPVFRRYEDMDRKPVSCGLDKNVILHYFGYYYCGDETVLNRFREFEPPKDESYEIEISKSRKIVMYDVCFDVKNNVPMWTQHSIKTPQLFQDPSKVQHYCEKDIGKDPFFTKKNFFPNLENKYVTANKESKTGLIVQPHPLVSEDHFAIRLGKKATNHYINRAPLWDKLIPLMTAIDEGIKRAVLKAHFKTPRNGSKENILIFTKIEYSFNIFNLFKKWFRNTDQSDLFEPNIWYKFVYDPVQQQGVIIYVHNIPKLTWMEKKCEKTINCDFTAWTRDENIRSKISQNELKYAYCCPITNEKLALYFPKREFKILNNFDIDSMATYVSE